MKVAIKLSVLKGLVFSQLAVMAPSFMVLPKWLFLFWLAISIWRFLIYKRGWSAPSFIPKVVILVSVVFGVLVSFSNLFSIEVFVSFFILCTSLKLLESQSKKDALLIISLNFICLSVGFLFYQNILMSVYVLCALWVLVCIWVSLFRARPISLGKQVAYSGKMLLMASPIMFVLFVSMPRLGQMWQMPSPSHSAKTGLSDTMSPGGISDLVKSNDVAFRVHFESGRIPDKTSLYWRALVFEAFDGRTWRRSPSSLSKSQKRYRHTMSENPDWALENQQQETLAYSVLLEPTDNFWLFSLMTPIKSTSEQLLMALNPEATLENRFRISSRFEYSVTSSLSAIYSPKSLAPNAREKNLKVSRVGNIQARNYAEKLRVKYGSGAAADQHIVDEVLSLFTSSFRYTLKPPLLNDNVIDRFLFETKSGFCEHFSSSFTFMMRSAGIPARVIVGYQGGELNPLENYLIIRQRDAHAWSEVWIEGKGWIRVDPTAAVSPLRIEQGLERAVSEEDKDYFGQGFSGFTTLAWLQIRYDLAAYHWHRLVVSFGSDTQDSFFKRILGGVDLWRIALFFMGSLFAIFAFALLVLNYPKRRCFKYEESRMYQLHLSKLKNLGYKKCASESALVFAQRVAISEPSLKTHLIKVASLYSQLAYQDASNHDRQIYEAFNVLCKKKLMPPK